MLCTWQMPKQGRGRATDLLCALRPVKTISLDFVQFSFRPGLDVHQLTRTGVRVVCWNDDVGRRQTCYSLEMTDSKRPNGRGQGHANRFFC